MYVQFFEQLVTANLASNNWKLFFKSELIHLDWSLGTIKIYDRVIFWLKICMICAHMFNSWNEPSISLQ